MFTCGLAADILFYSFSEWVLYATDPHLAEMGSIQDWDVYKRQVEVGEIESVDIDEAEDFMIADAIYNYEIQKK